MLVYLNDRFVPASEASVSVQDRGFRFGDGVFETIALRRGEPYQWAFHMQRLEAGLAALRISFNTAPLLGICTELLARNGAESGLLRIAVSRGVGSQGYLPLSGNTPTLVVETLAPAPPPAAPVELWLSAYQKISLASLPVSCKLAQGLQSTLARMEARDHGCFDGLLLDARGCIAEAASANIFWLKRRTLYTPSLECGALNGSVRHAIVKLSPWRVKEGSYRLPALRRAEAVMITNVAYGALPVGGLEPEEWRWESAEAAARVNDFLRLHAA